MGPETLSNENTKTLTKVNPHNLDTDCIPIIDQKDIKGDYEVKKPGDKSIDPFENNNKLKIKSLIYKEKNIDKMSPTVKKNFENNKLEMLKKILTNDKIEGIEDVKYLSLDEKNNVLIVTYKKDNKTHKYTYTKTRTTDMYGAENDERYYTDEIVSQ